MKPVHITPESNDVQQNRIFALLSYFGILLLIPMLARRESTFCRYHLNQGLVLFFADMVLNYVCGLIGILSILKFGILILMIMGIINCVKGVCAPLPLIGNIQILS
jgi:uncharacterized membrane protein